LVLADPEVQPVPNPVLELKLTERAQVLADMDHILGEVDSRDLTDAERQLLESTRSRVEALDEQIKPLAELEETRARHNQAIGELVSLGRPDRPPAPQPRRADGPERATAYRSAGAFVVDYLRGAGIMDRGVPDMAAQARVVQARVVADQKTSDTTGILPTPIVGTVVDLIDANRPLISSLGGAKALGGIPGATFTRPKITQHTTVGVQAGEKTQLSSQKMTITPVSFTKSTYGGTVDISRQDIDWTSPGAWDILIRDLANVYSVQTETAVAAAFKAAAVGTGVTVATNDLKGWTLALYTAAMHSYQSGFMMPDRVWCSLDVWAALGSLVDVARVVLPPDGYSGATEEPRDGFDVGASTLAAFRGDILGLPRIVVPTFAAGTCIVGPSAMFEVYEEVIGLLSVIEPSILGVQVAYGGYLAWGALQGGALVPLTVPAGLPTAAEAEAETPANGGNGGKAAK
jgi:HK97 family phage major capsid protein